MTALSGPPTLSTDISGVVVRLWENRFLVRPEGRVVFEVLKSSNITDHHIIVPQRVLLAALHEISGLYRDLSMQRLEDVVRLLSGQDPLQAQPLGIILWLLINRCTAPERAIRVRQVGPEYSSRIDKALRPAVDAFVLHLGKVSSARERRELSLYSAWQLTEAARRLGPRLITGATVHIAKGQEDAVIRIIAMDLSRRRSLNTTQLRNALHAFYTAYTSTTPQLASLSAYFELPHETQRIMAEIERLYIAAGGM